MTQFPTEDDLSPLETPATPLPAPEKVKPPAQAAHRVAWSSRDPEVRSETLRSAPPGYRELSIPAIDRGPFTQATKTLIFHLTYNDRPAAIAVTVNEKGRLVNAYVGGALATAVSERVLMAKIQQRPSLASRETKERWRELEESEDAAVKTLGENLADMECAASAVAKTVLESLNVLW